MRKPRTTSETTSPSDWVRKHRIKLALGILALFLWTAAAGDWEDKGCTTTQGYAFVVFHGGWPDAHEGCEDGYGDHPKYTHDYRG